MPRSPAKESPQKAAAAGGAVPPRRGRPSKAGKSKITVPIVATGKGRGRPKRAPKPDGGKEQRTVAAPGRKSKARKKSKAGRPRKDGHVDNGSEDDRSDVDKQDDEERRPVGRPSTGAISLNIVRTGRGQGRPKKGSKRAASKSSNGTPKKKIGRPSLGGVPYVPTGKPRGRPKLNKTAGKTQNKAEPQELLSAVGLGASSKDPDASEKVRGRSKIHAGADLGNESITDAENADGYSTSTSDKPVDRAADSEDGQADITLN